jgi:glycosyltransferase involved in cell wall biosynthesis
MKDVLMIAHFCNDMDGKGNNRFNYLAEFLAESGFRVELVTSDFSHTRKAGRDTGVQHPKYKLTYIREPGYKKNVSAQRFLSHHVLGMNLKKYLETRIKPDVIYCAVPSLDAAEAAAEYAEKNSIRFLIDIQDLWPEAFKMVFNITVVSETIFFRMKRQADRIYGAADEIIAVSRTYGSRALKASRKCREAHIVFIGAELDSFDRLAQENKTGSKPDGELWLAYIGTLGSSYDIICVMDALKTLQDKGIRNIKFIIMGGGPQKEKFSLYAEEKNIYAEFTGILDYGKMAGLLASCDIAVNPIRRGSAGSIINKHADYAAAGLPVVNTQESPEYRSLLEEYNAGLNCENGNSADLAEKLLLLYEDEELRKTMGANSRRLACEKFNRGCTYTEIAELIEGR